MSSKSNLLSYVYILIGAILVCGYANGLGPAMVSPFGIDKDLADVVIALAVVALGLLFAGLGAELPFVVITGTIGVFVVLTLQQTEIVRYMTLSAVLFCIGMYGMVVSRNAIRVLMSIELMLNAVNINFVAFSRYIDPTLLRGQVFAIFILAVAAAEAAVGLAIVLAIYRNMSTVDMEKFNLLKW